VYFGKKDCNIAGEDCMGNDPLFEERIDVEGSCEQRGARLYGKYDYYLIFNENIVRS
jgi:hypothetical protein